MKKYRACVADAYALEVVLTYIAERADEYLSDTENYTARAKEAEAEGSDPTYYYDSAAKYEGYAAAFERLLTKLSK